MNPAGPLVDNWGRVHEQLRISVTDRCPLRCRYCVGSGPVQILPRSALLTFEEILRFVKVVRDLGICRVRLTGGEPLLRKGLTDLVASLAKIPHLRDISLTTNGTLLARSASSLRQAGLNRVNISLDCLNPRKYAWLTGGNLQDVLDGIEAACNAGFDTVKINAVVIRNFSEDEIVPLAEYARKRGCQLRFIELMPTAQGQLDGQLEPLLAEEVLKILEDFFGRLVPVKPATAGGPATLYTFPDGHSVVGIIPAVSRPFCGNCNRLRLSADGKLRYCLFSSTEWDIRSLLRGGASDEAISSAVRAAVEAKWERRPHWEPSTAGVPMYRVGG